MLTPQQSRSALQPCASSSTHDVLGATQVPEMHWEPALAAQQSVLTSQPVSESLTQVGGADGDGMAELECELGAWSEIEAAEELL